MTTQEMALLNSPEHMTRLAELIAARITASSEIMNLKSVAIYMGRTEKAIRHLIAKGTIPATKVDGRIQVRRKDLDDLIERSRVN